MVRLAVKLGYDGFVGLQADVQSELARQLGPARERIRQRLPTDFLARVQAAEQDNVLQTLHGVGAAALDRSIARLADRHRRVWVLSAEMTTPIGMVLASSTGPAPGGSDASAGFGGGRQPGPGRTRAARHLDRHRHPPLRAFPRWPDASGQENRARPIIAVTDSPLSPLAAGAAETFFISAHGVGPFDSVTGGIALANVLVAGVAARLRQSAPARLDAIEGAWSAVGALVAEPGGRSPLPGIDRIAHPRGNGAEEGSVRAENR